VCPPRFRVLEGVLGKSLTLGGGEEWEGKIGYLYRYLGGLSVPLFPPFFPFMKKPTHCFTIPT
jgi:hypothetical protein